MPTLSTLPLEVKQLIAQHALALGRLAEVAPALARTPNDQRCISTLATLNSEWHRICRPILWEHLRLDSGISISLPFQAGDAIHLLHQHHDVIKTVDLSILEGHTVPAQILSSPIMPTPTVKRINLINRRGVVYFSANDSESIPAAQAACVVGFANGVEQFKSEFGMTIDGNGEEDNMHEWLIHTHQLLCAMPKLQHLSLTLKHAHPDPLEGMTRWDVAADDVFFRLLLVIRNKAMIGLDSLQLNLPYYDPLVSQPLPRWMPRRLSVTWPLMLNAPTDDLSPVPVYRLLRESKDRVEHLHVDNIPLITGPERHLPLLFPKLATLHLEHRWSTHESAHAELDALLWLIDPRTPVRQITYGTPSHLATQHLKQFIESQPVRTVKEVVILHQKPESDDEAARRTEHEDREFLEWCAEQKIRAEQKFQAVEPVSTP